MPVPWRCVSSRSLSEISLFCISGGYMNFDSSPGQISYFPISRCEESWAQFARRSFPTALSSLPAWSQGTQEMSAPVPHGASAPEPGSR